MNAAARRWPAKRKRSVDTGVLGRGASDPDVFAFARRAGAVLVTVNRGDFIALATLHPDHPGVLLVPSIPNQELLPLFQRLIQTAEPIVTARPGMIVELESTGRISSYGSG